MLVDKKLIYYRDFDSQYQNLGSKNTWLWLTDNIAFAKLYAKGMNSIAIIQIDETKLNCADDYDIEELFDFDPYCPDQPTCRALSKMGYNAYMIYSTTLDEMLCILDKSLITNIEIL